MANPARYSVLPDYRRESWDTDAERIASINAELNRYAERIKAGDAWALFSAIDLCSREQVPLPEGFRRGLRARLDRYASAEARELGEAFGIERPRRWQQAAARKFHEKALEVYYFVGHRRAEGHPTKPARDTKSAFDLAAAEFHISAQTAEEWYYAIQSGRWLAED